MSKFKVGDKVVRLVAGNSEEFVRIQGIKDYYTVTSTSAEGYWLQVDGVHYKFDPHPWCRDNFELYQEPGDDELPPAPESTLYMSSAGRRKLTVSSISGVVQLNIRLRDSCGYEDTLGYALDPDAALQLAHDLRRMAMDTKRKEKAQ